VSAKKKDLKMFLNPEYVKFFIPRAHKEKQNWLTEITCLLISNILFDHISFSMSLCLFFNLWF